MTVFHGYDCILGVKLMLVCLCTFSFTKIIMMFHLEPRPYWISELGLGLNNAPLDAKVIGYGCNTTYSNPDMPIFMLLFLVTYLRVCLKKASLTRSYTSWKATVLYVIYYGLLIFLVGLRYVSGNIFLLQILSIIIYNYLFS